MEIFEIYKILKKSRDWVTPDQLKQTRKSVYGMKQAEFADLIGVSYETYVTWERGRYTPSTPAQALLYIVTHNKELFLKEREKFLQKIGEY